jgi:hypothetical protein
MVRAVLYGYCNRGVARKIDERGRLNCRFTGLFPRRAAACRRVPAIIYRIDTHGQSTLHLSIRNLAVHLSIRNLAVELTSSPETYFTGVCRLEKQNRVLQKIKEQLEFRPEKPDRNAVSVPACLNIRS